MRSKVFKIDVFGKRSKKRKFSNFRPKNINLDNGAKFHVLTMLNSGSSVKQCARVIKCDPKTVRNVRNCAFSKSSKFELISREVKEALAHRKNVVEEMALCMNENGRKFTSSKKIAENTPFKCSATTVRRYLKERNIVSRVRPKRPKPYEEDDKKRLNFAIQQLSAISQDSSRSYIFSDEKIFDTNEMGSRRMWIRKGSKATPRHYQKWAPRIMVWGAVGINFRKLIIFNGSERINAKVYVEKILPTVARRVKDDPHVVYIQDGARPHTAQLSMKYIFDHKIDAPAWPPRSPDLNVIENLWSIVENQIKGNRGDDESSLAKLVLEAWNAIPTSTINKLVEGFTDRLVRCVQLRGGYVQ